VRNLRLFCEAIVLGPNYEIRRSYFVREIDPVIDFARLRAVVTVVREIFDHLKVFDDLPIIASRIQIMMVSAMSCIVLVR
jgi:hypothetical protein